MTRAQGRDHFPFSADLALPADVLGPVERSHGRHRWIATAWMNLRSGLQPVLAYFERTLVGLLCSLKVVIFVSYHFHKPCTVFKRFASRASLPSHSSLTPAPSHEAHCTEASNEEWECGGEGGQGSVRFHT